MLRSPAATAQQQRRSRRREETVISESAYRQSVKRIRLTTGRSRSSKTISGYDSYMASVHEYYSINHPELCTAEETLDTAIVREKFKTQAGTELLARKFKVFNFSRSHDSC